MWELYLWFYVVFFSGMYYTCRIATPGAICSKGEALQMVIPFVIMSINEELFFRIYLPLWLPQGVCTLLFGLSHLPNHIIYSNWNRFSPFMLLNQFIIGYVLSQITNIHQSILYHIGHNMLNIVYTYVLYNY